MKIGDSRSKGGAGFLPLQAHKSKWDIDKRPALLAYRLVDRLDGQDQGGQFIIGEVASGDSVGDLNLGFLWDVNRSKRSIPGWGFAWPVVTQRNPNATTFGGSGRCGSIGAFPSLLPIANKNYEADARYRIINTPSRPIRNGKPVWPKFALDWFGIGLVTTEEKQQTELWFPTDPRRVSVNNAGDPEIGSLTVDLNSDSSVDPDRTAREQSHTWVIKKPQGCVSFFGQNTLAWNIGPSG